MFQIKVQDRELRETDVLATKGVFRLIESVLSLKAELFKLWVTPLGNEQVNEGYNSEIAIKRTNHIQVTNFFIDIV